jgi:hypothetical protein
MTNNNPAADGGLTLQYVLGQEASANDNDVVITGQTNADVLMTSPLRPAVVVDLSSSLEEVKVPLEGQQANAPVLTLQPPPNKAAGAKTKSKGSRKPKDLTKQNLNALNHGQNQQMLSGFVEDPMSRRIVDTVANQQSGIGQATNTIDGTSNRGLSHSNQLNSTKNSTP